MRGLDRRSVNLDLAHGWTQPPSPLAGFKSHHLSSGLSAFTKIRNTLLFFTDDVVLEALVDKDNWTIYQSRK